MNDFELFWSHYPLKKAKGAAKKKFESLQKTKQLPDVNVLIKAIQDQTKEKAHLRNQNRFCPEWKHPSTWLNQSCWTDVCILPQERKPQGARVLTSFDILQKAGNVLMKSGHKSFDDYCRQLHISDYDRECVLMAANGGPRNVKTLAQGMLKEA